MRQIFIMRVGIAETVFKVRGQRQLTCNGGGIHFEGVLSRIICFFKEFNDDHEFLLVHWVTGFFYRSCGACHRQHLMLFCTVFYTALRVQFSDLIIPTIDTARQSYFLKVYLSHEVPLLFVGPTGTGKTAITSNYLMQLPKERSVAC